MAANIDYENAETISIDTLMLEERVQQERAKEISQLHSLSKKVSSLHTDLLYFRQAKSAMGTACYDAWRILVKKVGGTPDGWLSLGHCLGISQDDLNYIMYSVKDDHADMVLKVFRQNDNATIDKILDAFIKLKRYDILKSIEEPLCEMVKYFQKDDSGYQSNSTGCREIICLKNLPNDLPPALNKKIVIKNEGFKNPKQPVLRPPKTTETCVENDGPILFLTYAQDGLPTALNIQEYVENWMDLPNVRVITLNNRREDLYQNPEKFIREYFEKADIIIPIISPGYLEQITSFNPTVPNPTNNMDDKYVNFIYNLIINQYIHATGCLNKKVRSVLPQNSNPVIFQKMYMYPDLMPWTYEVNFDDQFKVFLKKLNPQ